MAFWPDLRWTRRSRFKDRVDSELEFYTAAYGESALDRIRAELERPELRSRYRDVLKATADALASQVGQPSKPATSGGLGATLRRMKSGKARSSAI